MPGDAEVSMSRKIHRMKLDINHLYELIDEVLSNSRSKIIKERGFAISVGLDLLKNYLRDIAERAIELNDDVLIDLLLDLHVLKET
jgi:hypothetical protein